MPPASIEYPPPSQKARTDGKKSLARAAGHRQKSRLHRREKKTPKVQAPESPHHSQASPLNMLPEQPGKKGFTVLPTPHFVRVNEAVHPAININLTFFQCKASHMQPAPTDNQHTHLRVKNHLLLVERAHVLHTA